MSLLRSKILNNINDAGKTGWCQNDFNPDPGFFTAIQSGLALNAMPTPYARAEVIKQAFTAIGDSSVPINFDSAGYTYQQLVSDTLDILEMLFEYELYKDNITIKSCQISRLAYPQNNVVEENGRSRKISYFKEALDKYKDVDERYLIVYNDASKSYVLAMSCPDTLFFTTSRLDRNNGAKNEYELEIPRRDNSGQSFFTVPRSLTKRSKEFQDYLYNLYVTNQADLGRTAFGMFIYSECDAHRKNSLDASSIAPLLDSTHTEVKIMAPSGNYISINKNCRPQAAALIQKEIVNLGFKINSERFATINNWNSHLIPLNLEALSKISNPDSVIENLSIVYTDVKTFDEKGNKYQLMAKDTKIEHMLPLDIGIYPFFKYPDTYDLKGKDTYNVILAYECERYHAEDIIGLSFYKKTAKGIDRLNSYTREEYLDPTRGISEGAVMDIRTNIVAGKSIRTLHYTIVGSQFDYIQVDFRLTEIKTSGVLCPRFEEPVYKNDIMKFAVDFGTTSTYIASKLGNQDPVVLTTKEQSMVFLHGNPSIDNSSAVYKYEMYNAGTECNVIESSLPELVKVIKNEFVPSSIDNSAYKFPMRTAISIKESVKNPAMFSGANIAFTYDKEPAIGGNKFVTNLKWAAIGNAETKLYIQEIIRLCVLHALSQGCSKENIEFLYFYPLAMNHDTYNNVKDAWEEGCKAYGLKADAARSMTESLAPYYAAPKQDASCVVSIDIGGGSVDAVVYKDREAQYAFSALFGCDVLWGGGKNLASNDKSNPIYVNIKPEMAKVVCSDDLHTIHQTMTEAHSEASSSEIMNFWLSNDNVFKVSEQLRLEKYKPVYVGHFYSVLYHVAQTMKVKGIEIPAEITLSGNGSTYLNYISAFLPKIAKAAFKDVYGLCDKEIKVTLPKELNFKGKEMTAMGGLKFNFDDPESAILNDKNFIYLGECLDKYNVETAGDKDLVMNDKVLAEPIVTTICDNVIQMEQGLTNLINALKLDVGNFFSAPEEYRTTLKEIVEDPTHGALYISARKIESTLFFVPIRQMIFKLEQEVKHS